MKLVAKGIQFTLTGTLNDAGDKAYRKLQKLGMEVAFSKSKTQVLIHEQSPSRKPEKAASWGIPVIDEKQLITLVSAGELSLETALDAPGGESSIDELLGEVRAFVAQSRRSETWDSLCNLVDACLPEQQEYLVNYIDDYIQRWPLEDQLLCKAPHDWLVQMMAEQESPKFRLVRSLDLFGEKHSAADALKALARESLTNLRSLNLHVSKNLSATIFKKIHTLPSCKDLVELGFGTVQKKHLDAIAEGDGLQSVTRFIWCDNELYLYGAKSYNELVELIRKPFFERVEQFAVQGAKSSVVLNHLDDEVRERFSRMTCLDFRGQRSINGGSLEKLCAVMQPERVLLGLQPFGSWYYKMQQGYPESVKAIEVHCVAPFEKDQLKRGREQLAKYAFPEWVETIDVRGYQTEVFAQDLAKRFPDVKVH
ncbi:MAG: BRCT domain-containing protein [Myxococcota bacterium]|nr:BRCT domain-containing protein [Myxococcota bacterium]MEC9442366.1 BRCT domain-containing protein [Myxococcota bacterium]